MEADGGDPLKNAVRNNGSDVLRAALKHMAQ